MPSGRRVRAAVVADGLAVALLATGALAAWQTAAHAGALPARGVAEIADAAVIAICAARAGAARRGPRSGFWCLIAIAMSLLTGGYAASALSRWLPATRSPR